MDQEFTIGQNVTVEFEEQEISGQITKHEHVDEEGWFYYITTTDTPNKTYGPFTEAQLQRGY